MDEEQSFKKILKQNHHQRCRQQMGPAPQAPQRDAAMLPPLRLGRAALWQHPEEPLCPGPGQAGLRAAALPPAELAWQGAQAWMGQLGRPGLAVLHCCEGSDGTPWVGQCCPGGGSCHRGAGGRWWGPPWLAVLAAGAEAGHALQTALAAVVRHHLR